MARKYTAAMKVETVRAIEEEGASLKELAANLGISKWTIQGWLRKARAERIDKAPEKELSVEEEVRRLREENRQLRMERDILKKATAFFAKEDT